MTSGPGLDLVIVGGCGHVGLPLALTFADAGCRVGIYDIDEGKVERVRGGEMPFRERGADELLKRLLGTDRLEISCDPAMVGQADNVVLVVGTPIDRHMNPSFEVFEPVVKELVPHLRPRALVVLRSTVFPGTTTLVADKFAEHGVEADVVFCPERIAEGYALEENRRLPQVIGAASDASYERAAELFGRLDVEIIRVMTRNAQPSLLTSMNAHNVVEYDGVYYGIPHGLAFDWDDASAACT